MGANGNEPAFPSAPPRANPGEWAVGGAGGLTKRELFAAMFTAAHRIAEGAWLSTHGDRPYLTHETHAEAGVRQADALLEALEADHDG